MRTFELTGRRYIIFRMFGTLWLAGEAGCYIDGEATFSMGWFEEGTCIPLEQAIALGDFYDRHEANEKPLSTRISIRDLVTFTGNDRPLFAVKMHMHRIAASL